MIRGDVEIVKILLENGADPYVENDLGMNAFDICNKAGPFPSVIRALQEHVNKEWVQTRRENERNFEDQVRVVIVKVVVVKVVVVKVVVVKVVIVKVVIVKVESI